jgi:hypothetical protein
MMAGLPAPPADSTSLLVQSMASFGASTGVFNSGGALPSSDPAQQSGLAAPIDQHLAHA